MKLKVMVDQDTCTACALCYDEIPEVYVDVGDGIAAVNDEIGGDGAIIDCSEIGEDICERVLEITEECPSGSLITETIEE
ncbi:MAG: ferredoxin [Aquificae bacterium]|nr:ferredoxin [Aquificota bacterium]